MLLFRTAMAAVIVDLMFDVITSVILRPWMAGNAKGQQKKTK